MMRMNAFLAKAVGIETELPKGMNWAVSALHAPQGWIGCAWRFGVCF